VKQCLILVAEAVILPMRDLLPIEILAALNSKSLARARTGKCGGGRGGPRTKMSRCPSTYQAMQCMYITHQQFIISSGKNGLPEEIASLNILFQHKVAQ
jgi:hypothetical protein